MKRRKFLEMTAAAAGSGLILASFASVAPVVSLPWGK
ncbi:twin-arginine translocation signal domain-containing protein [Kaarinaea lacus]